MKLLETFSLGGVLMDIDIITLIWSIISGLFTGGLALAKSKKTLSLRTSELEKAYEAKIKELEMTHTFNIRSLENALLLKDKDIEQMKIKHELDLKSKEADAVNPIIGKVIESFLQNPEDTSQKMLHLQGAVNKISGLQGHKKKQK